MNKQLLTASIVALLLSFILVWAVRLFALKFGIYDALGPLKIHKRPIPRLGGVGIVIALVGGVLASRSMIPGEVYLLSALVLIWSTGLIDDLRGLPPLVRLCIQVLAGLLVYRAGLCPLHNLSPLAGAFATCIIVVVFINAFNFLDGSDGLAAGNAAICSIGFAVLFVRQDVAWACVAASLAAACIGFLLFNFPPARIFMGDSGSTVLGLMLAILSTRFASAPGHGLFAVPLLILTIPVADFCLVVMRRVLSGRSPFAGDRSHFYDRLLEKGWSPRKVALLTYVLTLFCVLAGFAERAMHL